MAFPFDILVRTGTESDVRRTDTASYETQRVSEYSYTSIQNVVTDSTVEMTDGSRKTGGPVAMPLERLHLRCAADSAQIPFRGDVAPAVNPVQESSRRVVDL